MPTFTFEKISSAARSPAPAPAMMMPPETARKTRGVIVQFIDRLTEARIRRGASPDSSFTENDIKPPR